MADGFKKFPHSWRERLKELTPVQRVVWEALYLRSDKDGHSKCSNGQIANDVGLSEATVIKTKKFLKEHGWLQYDKSTYVDKTTGRFTIPTFECVLPVNISSRTVPAPLRVPTVTNLRKGKHQRPKLRIANTRSGCLLCGAGI